MKNSKAYLNEFDKVWIIYLFVLFIDKVFMRVRYITQTRSSMILVIVMIHVFTKTRGTDIHCLSV